VSTVVIRGRTETSTTQTALHLANLWRSQNRPCVGPVVVRRLGANEPAWACEVLEVGTAQRHPLLVERRNGMKTRSKRAAPGFHVVEDGLHHAHDVATNSANQHTLLILDLLNESCDRAALASEAATQAIVRLGELASTWPGPVAIVCPILQSRFSRACWAAIMDNERALLAARMLVSDGAAEWTALRSFNALVAQA
jgi:hypothetical protein